VLYRSRCGFRRGGVEAHGAIEGRWAWLDRGASLEIKGGRRMVGRVLSFFLTSLETFVIDSIVSWGVWCGVVCCSWSASSPFLVQVQMYFLFGIFSDIIERRSLLHCGIFWH